MIKATVKAPTISLIATFFIGTSFAQAEAQLNRIESSLKELKYPYTVDQGDYSVLAYWSAENRGHYVYIIGKPKNLGDGPLIYSIVAPAFKTKNLKLTENQLDLILSENSNRTIGAFELANTTQGETMVTFRASIPENFNSSTLAAIINYVGASADNLERELSNGKDEL